MFAKINLLMNFSLLAPGTDVPVVSSCGHKARRRLARTALVARRLLVFLLMGLALGGGTPGGTLAWAQNSDSSSLGAGSLSTSGVWDPNLAATQLSQTLTTVYNTGTSTTNIVNTSVNTANYAASVAQQAANSAATASANTSSASGLKSVTRIECGTLLFTFFDGSTQVGTLAACTDR